MRILMVAPEPFFRPRGTPLSVLHRIRALTQLGNSVDLVTYPFGDDFDLSGLTVHRCARPAAVRDVAIGPSVQKLVLDVPLFFKALALARTGEFDLLHTHEEAGAMGAFIARLSGLPHLYDMHSNLAQQFNNFGRFNWRPVRAVFRRLERFALDGSDGVIVVYPALRDHVRERGYQGPLALIENTLDFSAPVVSRERLIRLRRELGVPDKRVVIYTGTLEPYQGLELLIGAAGDVLRSVKGARFVIVGGTSAQVDQLRSLAQRKGVADGVIFRTAVPAADVFLYHHVADVLVTTRARGTNTPLKLYQYLRAGKPIVATDIEAHTQVLNPDCAELVCADPASIATGLVRVLTDRERARSLTAAATQLASDEYSEEIYFQRLGSLLSDIFDRQQRAGTAAA